MKPKNNWGTSGDGKGVQLESNYKGIHTFLSKDNKKYILLTALITNNGELVKAFSKLIWTGFESKGEKEKINNFSHFLKLYNKTLSNS